MNLMAAVTVWTCSWTWWLLSQCEHVHELDGGCHSVNMFMNLMAAVTVWTCSWTWWLLPVWTCSCVMAAATCLWTWWLLSQCEHVHELDGCCQCEHVHELDGCCQCDHVHELDGCCHSVNIFMNLMAAVTVWTYSWTWWLLSQCEHIHELDGCCHSVNMFMNLMAAKWHKVTAAGSSSGQTSVWTQLRLSLG